MKNKLNKLIPIILSIIFVLLPFQIKANEVTNDNDNLSSQSIEDFRRNEEKLWIEHVYWTRDYIKSDLSVLRDRDDVLRRLIKNQEDIGNSIKPYYSDAVGNKLQELLKKHIEIELKVIHAYRMGDKDGVDNITKQWNNNADEIVQYLSSINPNYDKEALKEMIGIHIELTKEEITRRISSNWKADIDNYEKGQDNILNFANILVDGIVKQFPEKFNTNN